MINIGFKPVLWQWRRGEINVEEKLIMSRNLNAKSKKEASNEWLTCKKARKTIHRDLIPK